MTQSPEGFPWRRFMELGLGVLHLSPREFWATTPRELAAASGTSQRPAMPRDALHNLMQRFPDAT